MDPVLFTYQSAIAQLMHNQQIALAGFLAASAIAHLPVQPELTPLQAAQLFGAAAKAPDLSAAGSAQTPPSGRQLAVKGKKAGHCRGPGATGVSSSVIDQARMQQQRLRFVFERHRESLKRVMSIGNFQWMNAGGCWPTLFFPVLTERFFESSSKRAKLKKPFCFD